MAVDLSRNWSRRFADISLRERVLAYAYVRMRTFVTMGARNAGSSLEHPASEPPLPQVLHIAPRLGARLLDDGPAAGRACRRARRVQLHAELHGPLGSRHRMVELQTRPLAHNQLHRARLRILPLRHGRHAGRPRHAHLRRLIFQPAPSKRPRFSPRREPPSAQRAV